MPAAVALKVVLKLSRDPHLASILDARSEDAEETSTASCDLGSRA